MVVASVSFAELVPPSRDLRLLLATLRLIGSRQILGQEMDLPNEKIAR